MAQPRRDFPPGKGLYMGGRRDLSPTAGQTPPERRQGEAMRRSVFSPRRLHRPRRDPAVRQGCCPGDNALGEVSADNPSVALRAPAPVVPKAWPPPTKRRWRLGRRSRCPKFFARYRSQNFDRCHSFLLAFSAAGGARKRPPFHKGAFNHATPAASRRQSRQVASRIAGTSNRSRQLTWDLRPAAAAALPPPKPLRGQADSRHF